MRVGIVGGGVTGLVAAYRLAKQNHQVVVFEKSNQLGGLCKTFSTDKDSLECFYHHIFSNDSEIIDLISELGLTELMFKVTPKTGLFYSDKLYPFTSPFDILQFKPLSPISRLRLGVVSAYLKYLSPWENLQTVTALNWCNRYFGSSTTQVVWKPLLSSKFGKYANEITMSWLWARLKKRSFSLIYLKGSFNLLVKALSDQIISFGGQVRQGVEVTEIKREGNVLQIHGDFGEEGFDNIISTVAPPILADIADFGDDNYQRYLKGVPFLSASTLVIKTKKVLTDYYWINVNDTAFPFLAMVEQGNLVSPSQYGGYNYIYFGNYWANDDPRLSWDARETLERYLPFIKKIAPDFRESDIEDVYKFDAPNAQPIVRKGYKEQIPKIATPWPHFVAGSIATIYPWDRGLNYSVTLADDLIKELGIIQESV